MVRLESFEDKINGVVTYEFSDGCRIRLDARAVRHYGAATLLRDMGYGHLLPTEPVVVIQNGRRIGTVPPSFDPLSIKSSSYLYDHRPGDFRRDGNAWIASNTLGPGDMDAIDGFMRDADLTKTALK